MGCTSQIRTEKSVGKVRIKFKTDGEKVLESFKILLTYGVFNRMVVGFGPKGMPARMCDSVC